MTRQQIINRLGELFERECGELYLNCDVKKFYLVDRKGKLDISMVAGRCIAVIEREYLIKGLTPQKWNKVITATCAYYRRLGKYDGPFGPWGNKQMKLFEGA